MHHGRPPQRETPQLRLFSKHWLFYHSWPITFPYIHHCFFSFKAYIPTLAVPSITQNTIDTLSRKQASPSPHITILGRPSLSLFPLCFVQYSHCPHHNLQPPLSPQHNPQCQPPKNHIWPYGWQHDKGEAGRPPLYAAARKFFIPIPFPFYAKDGERQVSPFVTMFLFEILIDKRY